MILPTEHLQVNEVLMADLFEHAHFPQGYLLHVFVITEPKSDSSLFITERY